MGSKRPDRRDFLKRSAALAGGLTLGGAAEPTVRRAAAAAAQSAADQSQEVPPMLMEYSTPELIAYGERSKYVSSVRQPVNGRPSPDDFDLVFHVGSPLDQQMGAITPSALHYVGTTRGSFVPDIDPAEHRLMIHGMVERPITLTMDDLMRFPSTSQIRFLECPANGGMEWRGAQMEGVQFTHGMLSCCEWTGVMLSTLLEEVGIDKRAAWILAEGADGSHMSRSIPMDKALDDAMIVYAQNGEMLRPEQGYPVRLINPG